MIIPLNATYGYTLPLNQGGGNKMKIKELIEACNSYPVLCNGCPYDPECTRYHKKYGTVPWNENELHPERYNEIKEDEI